MVFFPKVTWSLAGLLLLSSTSLLADTPAGTSKARPASTATKFIRLRRNAQNQPAALETAIVRYVPASGEGGLEVDLVSVVHIGDGPYYEQLNKQLATYDVVLYELVAPPGTRIPRGGKRHRDNPLAVVQQMMKLVLDLDSQVEQIDYTRKNFVHADLSPEQMAEAVHKRGDDSLTLFLSITADLLRQRNLQALQEQKGASQDEEDLDLGSLLLDPEGPMKLKRLLAEQLAAVESPEGGLGPTLGTILIADRNQAALKVFQKELARGKKKVAIFYGAGHMPDFEKRLQDDFGLKRTSTQWLTAWDLQKEPRELGIEDVLRILQMLGD